jgi:hypothetical protein
LAIESFSDFMLGNTYKRVSYSLIVAKKIS